MTTRKIFFSLLILTIFGIVSCSKDNGTVQKPEEPAPQPEIPQSNDNGQGNTNEQSKLFVYKAFVEDITGSWCPNCPNISNMIDQMKRVTTIRERIVPVAVHSGGKYNGYDPMIISHASPIYQYYRSQREGSLLQLTGLPYCAMNRNTRLFWSNGVENMDNFLKEHPSSPIGIKIASNLTNDRGTVSVAFTFKANYTNLKYGVFVIEDGYVYDQSNNTDLYGGGYLPNFVHNDVLRAAYGRALGNDLGAVTENTEVKKEDLQLTYTLLNPKGLENARVVVFVADANGHILNVQQAKANQTVDYQYAE